MPGRGHRGEHRECDATLPLALLVGQVLRLVHDLVDAVEYRVASAAMNQSCGPRLTEHHVGHVDLHLRSLRATASHAGLSRSARAVAPVTGRSRRRSGSELLEAIGVRPGRRGSFDRGQGQPSDRIGRSSTQAGGRGRAGRRCCRGRSLRDGHGRRTGRWVARRHSEAGRAAPARAGQAVWRNCPWHNPDRCDGPTLNHSLPGAWLAPSLRSA